jgi:hypothetical protein
MTGLTGDKWVGKDHRLGGALLPLMFRFDFCSAFKIDCGNLKETSPFDVSLPARLNSRSGGRSTSSVEVTAAK